MKAVWGIVMSAVILVLTACGAGPAAPAEQGTSEKIIAILGWDEYVEGNEDFINGMNMALAEWDGRVSGRVEYYNDEGNYDKGLLMAQELCKKSNVAAVFSFQDFEVIDAEAPYFEDAGVPLFAVQGCYEKTLERDLGYIFSSYVSSRDMGAAAARYCAEKKISRVACCHTDTQFEKDEVRGFCAEAQDLGITVTDLLVGLDTESSLERAYQKWKTLGTQALFLCKYTETEEEKEWIFRMIQYIKMRDPDFLILGDYSLNGPDYLKKYGKNMEGTVYPRPYSVTDSVRSEEFQKKYLERYPDWESVDDGAYQGYDMTRMVGEALREESPGTSDGTEVRDFFKREEGYDGVSGHLSYSEEGKIRATIEYYCVHDGAFVMEEAYE